MNFNNFGNGVGGGIPYNSIEYGGEGSIPSTMGFDELSNQSSNSLFDTNGTFVWEPYLQSPGSSQFPELDFSRDLDSNSRDYTSSSSEVPTGGMGMEEGAVGYSDDSVVQGMDHSTKKRRKRGGKTREEKNQEGKEYRARQKNNHIQMQQDIIREMKAKEDLEALLQRMGTVKNQVTDALRIVARSRYPEAFGEDPY